VAEITLTQVPPATGALPRAKGGMTLALVDPGPLTSIAPFRGQAGAVSEALKTATGLALGPGHVALDGAAIQWFGRDLWLLTGVAAPDLPGAALSDQTDAWVTLELTGPHIAEVMARLVPLDLRDPVFPHDGRPRAHRAGEPADHGLPLDGGDAGPDDRRGNGERRRAMMRPRPGLAPGPSRVNFLALRAQTTRPRHEAGARVVHSQTRSRPCAGIPHSQSPHLIGADHEAPARGRGMGGARPDQVPALRRDPAE